MPVYTVTDPNSGKTIKLRGDSPPSEQELEQIFAAQQPASPQGAQQSPSAAVSVGGSSQVAQQDSPSYESRVAQNLGDLAAGAVRGAGSIGATLLTPYDLAAGNTKSIGNPERRQAMDQALQTIGANPESGFYKGGKLAGEVAGTAGAGGAMAKGAQALGAAPSVVSALSTGGMKLSTPAATTAATKAIEWLTRIGSGAVVGGAQAGMVDPTQAAEGAAIGGAFPVATKVAGEAGKALKNGSSWFMTHSLGALTGTSPETVSAAFQAGKKGATEFLDNMRGKVDFGDVVDAAKQGLANMRDARAQAYRSGMVDIKADQTVLDFAGIDRAMKGVVSTGSFKGVPIRQKAAETVSELTDVIDNWRGLDPAQYHTPEGFDALKQAVGDIRDSTQFGTPARRAADAVYNSVKAEINRQAPTYATVMKDYETSSRAMKEIEKALSLGDKASKDTAIRKLQSLMRNNVQSNYGNRLNLAKQLEEKGGVELGPSIAGQAMSSWMPRGMTGVIEKAGAVPTAVLAPQALVAAPLTSPRLVGEAAYLLGRGAGGAEAAGAGANALLNLSPTQRIAAMNALLRTPAVIGLASQTNQR